MQKALAAGALVVAVVVTANAEEVPILDVDPLCRGIAAHATAPDETGRPDLSFAQCVNQELQARNTLIKHWMTFSAKSKHECVGEAHAGGLASYTDLLTCLQTARDVEHLGRKRDDQ
jgi:hypothetical protein